MPRSNHSHRLHAPFEGGVTQATRGGADRDFEESAGEAFNLRGHVGEFVDRNAGTTVFAGFAFGFGLGLFVTLLMTRRESGWFERYAPEVIQGLPETLKQFPERLKHVPEAVASYVPSSWKRW